MDLHDILTGGLYAPLKNQRERPSLSDYGERFEACV
jgi:hypothetical protein